jgi:hypothetical protein
LAVACSLPKLGIYGTGARSEYKDLSPVAPNFLAELPIDVLNDPTVLKGYGRVKAQISSSARKKGWNTC